MSIKRNEKHEEKGRISLVRNEEVRGSSPLTSTKFIPSLESVYCPAVGLLLLTGEFRIGVVYQG